MCIRDRAGALQPFLPAGPRRGLPRGRTEARTEPAVGTAPAAALDRDPALPPRRARVARRIGRGPHRHRCGEGAAGAVSYTHLRAHETVLALVCRLLLEK